MNNVRNVIKVKWKTVKVVHCCSLHLLHNISLAELKMELSVIHARQAFLTTKSPFITISSVIYCVKGHLLIHHRLPMHTKSPKGQNNLVSLHGRQEEKYALG